MERTVCAPALVFEKHVEPDRFKQENGVPLSDDTDLSHRVSSVFPK